MRAVTLIPGVAGSARLDELEEPAPHADLLRVRMSAVGVCGTDVELIEGRYGWAPPGKQRLVIGHESLGVVEEAPPGSGFARGDLVAGIVRRPDPEPCANCAAGEWDMCANGRYTEHGIKEIDGFAAECVLLEPRFTVRVDPSLGLCGVLTEPASVVAKAWEHIERLGRRAVWSPRRVLVTGAGPIGLLAALLGVQRGLEVTVLDRVTQGVKPDLVRALGARYTSKPVDGLDFAPDVTLECTGVPAVLLGTMKRSAANGIVCLTGVSSGGHALSFDLGALNRSMVLENEVVFGSVNANARHYRAAADALARADRAWLERLLTRRVPLERWQDAYARRDDDVKTVLLLGD
jgi:threonine dehydrogenase-like Zn-dependent dehydrogenase